jgi:5-methylcytosine-specific restriction endonuclease McrA
METKNQKTEKETDNLLKEEVRKKLSELYKGRSLFAGRKHSKKTRKIISDKLKKYFSDPKNRENMRLKHLGTIRSKESKEKQAQTLNRWWKNNPKAKGRKAQVALLMQSKINRAKISAALKGKKHSKEHSAKVSASIKAKWATPEYREKMLKANRTEEIRKKRSELSSGEKNAMFGICGEKSPNWCGGISKLPYGFEFDDNLKALIKNRDNNMCQECGTNKYLHIHHIDYNKLNNQQSNLITLCRRCNPKANFNREYWIERYKKLINK